MTKLATSTVIPSPHRAAPLARADQPQPADCASRNHLLNITRAVADATRLQVLRALQQESFGVQELCAIVGLAQPALSHHLKVLHEAGMLAKRREGNSIYYRREPADANSLAGALFCHIDKLPLDSELSQRMTAIQQQRRSQGQQFFASNADALSAQQARICNSSVYAASALDMAARHCPANQRALEVGPGDGHLARLLAEQFTEVLGIDSSAEMLQQTAKAVGQQPNLRLRCQAFEQLGKSNRFDLIVASMVVHHVPSPATFFQTAQQLMRKSSVLLVAELCLHDQQWAKEACGDLWLGFTPQDLQGWAETAGLQCQESQYLAQRNGFQIQLHAFAKRTTSRISNTQ
jgi:DNA-binding transcriptional ArsR family regulator/ubiquinone/menaquinone biosynthesis C-methylase UbiE